MKFYRVHAYTFGDSSLGFTWHTSMKDARRQKKANGDTLGKQGELADIEVYDVTPTKAGILAMLNACAAHPDNG